MANASEQTLALLGSINAHLETLVAIARGGGASVEVADDADLDGKYGDPQAKFTPRDWKMAGGADFKGCNFSTCDPAFLDQLASAYDYFAKKNDEQGLTANNGKPKSYYDRKEAARARGWAKRIRSGWKPAAIEATGFGGDDFGGASEWPTAAAVEPMDADEIPF